MLDQTTALNNQYRYQAQLQKEESDRVVANYKECNKETVEVLSHVDHKLKAKFYKKVKIDPNAKKFVIKKKDNSNTTVIKRTNRMPSEDRIKLAKRYAKQGKNAEEISVILGVHPSTIRKDLK